MDKVAHKILGQMGDFVNARFAALEDRLLPGKIMRPALKERTQAAPSALRQQEQQAEAADPAEFAAVRWGSTHIRFCCGR